MKTYIVLIALAIALLTGVEHYEDGSGTVFGVGYCLHDAPCYYEEAEYECRMLLAETSDLLPEDIVEVCQP